jgi:putative nucleotidyltransferase with HDIG domain
MVDLLAPLGPADLEARIRQLAPLPALVMEALALLEDEGVDLGLLEHKVSQDQALAARILKIANSPFYGFPASVGSLREACVVLGLSSLRNIVVAAAVMGRFGANSPNGFPRPSLWQHAVGTGICARVLGQRARLDPDLGFTCGLLHDVGKLALDTYFAEHYGRVLAHREANGCLLREAELEVLGFDHALVGARVASRWRLPEAIVAGIGGHHDPVGAASPYASLVHLADIVCRALEIGNGGDDLIPPLAEPALLRLGLGLEQVRDSLEEMEGLNAGANLILQPAA